MCVCGCVGVCVRACERASECLCVCVCSASRLDDLLSPAPLSDKSLENHTIFRVPIVVVPGESVSTQRQRTVVCVPFLHQLSSLLMGGLCADANSVCCENCLSKLLYGHVGSPYSAASVCHWALMG